LWKFYQQIFYVLLKRHVYAATSHIRVLPDLIVIGVVRGGTTSLYHYLSQHPCITKSAYDELGFFDSNFHLGLNWYRSLFPTIFERNRIKSKYGHFMTFDVTPFYIYNPHAAQRVLDTLPRAKIISILRNPVDRAYSNYYLGVRSGNEKRTFEDAINYDLKIIQNNKDMSKDDNYFEQIIGKSYLARGFYAEQLQIWMNKFPREQLLIISTEDLATKTNNTLEIIFDFLGLPNHRIKDLTKRNEAEYPPMNPDTRKMLIEYFKPYNEKLYSLLGRRFDWDR
jgi:hypothetical protein